MNDDRITSFTGKHRFLSNFYTCSVYYGGILYNSSEAAYQAQKSTDPEVRKHFAKMTARDAKRHGKRIKLRDNWEAVKRDIMFAVLKKKFLGNTYLLNMLLSTGDAYLEEGNNWGDRYWGVCKGKGENILGTLLMKLREQAKQAIIMLAKER